MIDTSKLDEPRWYVLHTFTGYEAMAVDNLNKCIAKNNLQEYILEVKIPMETVIEEGKNGKIGCLYIDIFPLDIGNDKWGVLSRNWWIKHIMGINIYKYQWPNTLVEKIVASIVRLFPTNFFLKISRKMLFRNGDYILNYGGYWGKKEIVRKDIFGTPKRYEFEDIFLNGVSDSDMYLQKLYGNYMELPPEDKRHIHILSFKVKERSL